MTWWHDGGKSIVLQTVLYFKTILCLIFLSTHYSRGNILVSGENSAPWNQSFGLLKENMHPCVSARARTCTKISCTEEDDITKQLLFLRISSLRTNYYSTSIVPPLMLPTSEYDVDYIYNNGINMMNRGNTRLVHWTEEVELPCVVVVPDLQTWQVKSKLNETSLNSFIYSISLPVRSISVETRFIRCQKSWDLNLKSWNV